jgi:hypothetical protein
MSGYAVTVRIVRASPRLIEHGPAAPAADWRPSEAGPVVLDGGTLVAPATPITLGERVDRFRDRWAQLTFFVTDPDSWR